MTNINHIGPSGIFEALTYAYDPAGNRTSLTRNNGTASLLPSAVASATYDAANEQTAFAGAALTYDNNGNLTSDGVNTYQWDARNRLIGISGGATANFVYDPLGRRTSNTINSVNSQFAYDGNDIVAEIGGGAVGANYLHSLNIDEPFVRQTGTSNEFYHTDALGSSLALSNAQGVSATAYTYEPFGKATTTGTSGNAFQFTGRESDGLGLAYYRARYYSSTRHRFMSEDPLRLDAGDVNFYTYVFNNPARLTDPFGLAPPLMPPNLDVCDAIQKAQQWGSDRNNWIDNPWVYHVRPGGDWDLKRSRSSIRGQIDPKYVASGNYLYGLTGRAYGLNSDELQGGAGAANILENGFDLEKYPPGAWFDSKDGHPWVVQGMTDYDEGYWKARCNKPSPPSKSAK